MAVLGLLLQFLWLAPICSAFVSPANPLLSSPDSITHVNFQNELHFGPAIDTLSQSGRTGLRKVVNSNCHSRSRKLALMLSKIGRGGADSTGGDGDIDALLATVVSFARRGKEAVQKFFETGGGLRVAVVSFAVGLLLGLSIQSIYGATQVYKIADDIPGRMVTNKARLGGYVVTVSDGDTMRVRHTPALSLPRGPGGNDGNGNGKGKSGNNGYEGKLTENTISVRLAMVDAPETAKFGNQGQPFGPEAKEYVKGRLLNKQIKLQLLQRDRYGRVVAKVYYRPGPDVMSQLPLRLVPLPPSLGGYRDLSSDLLSEGFAVVYAGQDGEFDGQKEKYQLIEAKARERKVGVWSQKNFQTPAQYKAQQRAEENGK